MIQIVNLFNATHEASQVVYAEDGKTRLIHYVISDFGITRTNLVIQVYNFRQAAQAFATQIFAAPAQG